MHLFDDSSKVIKLFEIFEFISFKQFRIDWIYL